MCGINGFTWGDASLVSAMNDKLKHRGPDGDGVFVDGHISLGHRRLAIIDLSDRGAQPMTIDDKRYYLVFNGEIYNYRNIRKELEKKGEHFFSDSDSEVLLRAYKVFGPECLGMFNGIFSFAIWDTKDRRLFLARDRMGVKPLYYTQKKDQIIFSSEIKALFVHDIVRSVDRQALSVYMRMLYVPVPLTMFDGIRKLPVASYAIFKNHNLSITKYWQPMCLDTTKSITEVKDDVRFLMKDSVRLQMISDRSVGVFLSGGIDSSVVASLAVEQSEKTLSTFSLNFDVPHEKFNMDAILARKTAEQLGTDHHEIVLTGEQAAASFEKVIYHMDEPVANATQIATYTLSELTHKTVPVVLGGDGGDELFAGYERYRLSRYISLFQRLPQTLQAIAKQGLVLAGTDTSRREKLSVPPGVERYMTFMSQRDDVVARILKIDAGRSYVNSFYDDHFFQENDNDIERALMRADLRSWLPDESLLRSDKMSMAWGLEQRVPILDHRLVELAMTIPSAWNIRGKHGKVIFREAMEAYIPDHVRGQKKRGWFSPTSEWLRGPMNGLARELLTASFAPDTEEFFDFESIHDMLDGHLSKKEYNMNLIWALMTFQQWYRTFIHDKV